MNEDVRTNQILDSGSMEDKIIVLESLSQSSDQETVNKIISKLDGFSHLRSLIYILRTKYVKISMNDYFTRSTILGLNYTKS